MVQKTVFMRIYLLILVIFVVIMTCFGLLIYQNATSTVRHQLGSKCIGIATSVAVIIEMDIDGFREFSRSLDVDSAYYTETYARLNKIRRENEGSILFLYTEIRVSETEKMYIIDSEDSNSPVFSPPGYVEELIASDREAYRLRTTYISDEFIDTDEYGSVLSCFAPIIDQSNGEFVGLVGVDVSIDQQNAIMQNQLVIIFSSIAALVLILGFTLILSSGRVERITMRDSLTGIYNRAHFLRTLKQQLKYANRKSTNVTVIMADIDHFKRVNDTYGHPFGDIILCSVADTIGSVLRKTDCLARYGGEEFVAFLTEGTADLLQVVERIRHAVEQTKVINAETNDVVQVTISIGVAYATSGRTATDAIDMADKALYQAKNTRNTVCVYK